jgi:hypothetical protein
VQKCVKLSSENFLGLAGLLWLAKGEKAATEHLHPNPLKKGWKPNPSFFIALALGVLDHKTGSNLP